VSELAFYKIIIPNKILNSCCSGHIVLLEKIIAADGSDVAAGLTENRQPVYYMNDDLYMSENIYMGGPSGEYSLEFIHVEDNILNGAKYIRDYATEGADTNLFGYRFRHVWPVKQSDQTIKYSEYISRYQCFKKVKDVDKLYNVYNTSGVENAFDYSTRYGGAARPRSCHTIRNIAYRGRNDVTKYNRSLIEINSDIIKLDRQYTNINNTINNFQILSSSLFDPELFNMYLTAMNVPWPSNFLDKLGLIYDMMDKVQIIRKLKDM